jgi:hypothetical protein
MFVRIQNGYETDELHDVLFSSKAEGDLIAWDNATGVWRNTKELSGSYIVTGTLNVNDDLTVGTDSLFVDTSADRLGVALGGALPSASLHVRNNASRILLEAASNPTSYNLEIVNNFNAANKWYIGQNTGSVQYIGHKRTDALSNNAHLYLSSFYGMSFHVGNVPTGSNAKMVINSSGKVGIGTNTPEHTLSVTGTLGVSGNTTLSTLTASNAEFTTITADTITAREYYTELVTASVIYESGSTKFGDDANDIHQFSGSIRQSGSTLANYFLGSLAVGDSNPASYKLYVNGTSRFADSIVASGILYANDHIYLNTGKYLRSIDTVRVDIDTDNNQTDRVFVVSTNNAAKDLLTVQENGNVGIGTSSPNALLAVSESNSSPTNKPILELERLNNVSSPTTASADLKIKSHSSNVKMYIEDHSSNPLLYMNGSGQVGIGTASPSKKLHVYQGSDGEIRFEGGSGTETKMGVTGGYPFLGSNGSLKILSSNTQAMFIDSSQNILIGSSGSPSADLHLYRTSGDADLRVETTTAGQDSTMNLVCANSTTSTAHIRFYNGNNWYAGALLDSTNFAIGESSTYGTDTHLVVNTAGNVGIGTTSPSTLLHVSGSSSTLATFERNGEATILIKDTDGSANARVEFNNGGVYNSYVGTSANQFAIEYGPYEFLIRRDNGTLAAKFDSNGNFGIGGINPGANLDVSGSTIFGRLSSDTHEFSGSVNVSGTLTATAKSFDIPHPTKDGMRLRYGSLEGAENGVYVRGMTTGSVIELPEHWTGLVDEETITVNLTPYGTSQQLWVKKIEDNKVYIGGKLNKCFFTVFGERKDIDKLVVEY